MTAPSDLGRLVPGFDFLQNLMKGAGAALPGLTGGSLPGLGQWVAPTLDPAELDKRIQDLKAVQFWLESNAKLLASTIQALEVQRMTLATLKTMNLPMADLAEALRAKPAASSPAPAPAPEPSPEPAPPPTRAQAKAAPEAPAAIDPVQWWGALTQQFTDIAAKAMADVQDGAEQAARAMAAAGGAKPAARSAASAGAKAAAKAPAKATRATPSKAGPSKAGPAKTTARGAARRRTG